MNQRESKLEVAFAGAMFIAVIAFVISGFLGLEFKQSENCWNKYETEEQAIINCEGVTND